MEEKDVVQQRDLPHDLISQNILPRLPVELLARFKSVSKQWYSTLSSPDFALAHFNFPHPSSAESLLIQSDDSFTLFSYENGDHHDAEFARECGGMKLRKMKVNFDIWDDNLVLVGSCNGLVCLGSVLGRLFIIWNPITREFRQYLDAEIGQCVDDVWTVSWGFGYTSAVDDYKIVRICKNVFSDSINVHVFSLRSNKWRRIDNDSSHNFSDLRTVYGKLDTQGVLVHETLYWIGGIVIEELCRKIVFFDLALELFDTFPHLDMCISSSSATDDDYDCFDVFLCVVKGCLSKYGIRNGSGEGVITVLKSPGDMKRVILPQRTLYSPCEDVIGFTGSDKFFTQHCGDAAPHLGMVDPSSQPVTHTPLMHLQGSKIAIISYYASLISPVTVTQMPEKSNH